MSRGQFTTPDGLRLAFDVAGQGPAVLWQHGLGAGFDQPLGVFPDLAVTRITLACRGHEDSDLGPAEALSIARFAEDAAALLDHLGIDRLHAAGGISLGAALALRLAADRPGRVGRLVLARPAWVDAPAPPTLAAYVEAGRLLDTLGADAGRARFAESPALAEVAAVSPDNAKSLLGFFARPRPDTTVALLSRIPLDGPGVSADRIAALALPTLVIGTTEDFVHPLTMARTLAGMIPGARLTVVPPKSSAPEAHAAAVRAALAAFLQDPAP